MENSVEFYRKEIYNFITSKFDFSGILETEIPSLSFYKTLETTNFSCSIYEPSLCIILQGSKEVSFGDELASYGRQRYLLSCAHLPINVKIQEASKDEPFVSLVIKFSLADVYDVIKSVGEFRTSTNAKSEKGILLGTINSELLELVYRLVSLCGKDKKYVKNMSNLILKEILYHLVLSENSGEFLAKFAVSGSIPNKISMAVAEIRTNFSEKLNIKELANLVDMSESSLYQNFKIVTSLSPIQFQKRIRLEEARNMLNSQKAKVSEIAFAVGYESPSQFNREYARMYGISPKAHASLGL